MDKAYLEDILPYFNCQDNAVIFKDGSVGYIFDFWGIPYDSGSITVLKNAQGNDELHSSLEDLNSQFLNILKTVFNDCKSNISIAKCDIFDTVKNEKTISYNTDITGERSTQNKFLSEQLQEHISTTQYLSQKSILVIKFDDFNKWNKKPYDSLLYKPIQVNPSNLLKAQGRIKETYDYFIDQFLMTSKDIGIHLHPLSTQEINTLIYQYLNLEFKNQEFQFKKDFEKNEKNTRIGDKYLQCLTLQETPEEITKILLYNYNGDDSNIGIPQFFSSVTTNFLQVPHITITSLKLISESEFKNNFTLENTVGGIEVNIDFLKPILGKLQKKASHIEYITGENIEMCYLSQHIFCYDEDINVVKERIKYVKARLSNAYKGAIFIDETIDTLGLFFSNVLGYNGSYKNTIVPLSVGVSYMDFCSKMKGSSQGLPIGDRFGKYVNLNLKDDNLKSKNAIVVGETGSGKSFTTGYLMINYHLQGDIQIIIDRGGTYKGLVENLGGQLYEHTAEYPLKFNPMAMLKNDGMYRVDTEDFNDKLIFLDTLFPILWKGINTKLTPEESSILKDYIKKYYLFLNQCDQTPSLQSFCEYFTTEFLKCEHVTDKHFDIKSFEICLAPYLSGGMYSNIFCSDNKIITENQMIYFELESVQKDGTLFPILSILIIETVLEYLKKDPNKFKHIVIDEAWSMFTGTMKDFIVYMYRTIRKRNGAVKIITQGISELVQTGVADVVRNNSHITMLLKYNSEVSAFFELNKREDELFRSLRYQDVRGRELFIKLSDISSNVYDLSVPKYWYPFITSHPSEREFYRMAVQETLEVEDAIRLFYIAKEMNILETESKERNLFFRLHDQHGSVLEVLNLMAEYKEAV